MRDQPARPRLQGAHVAAGRAGLPDVDKGQRDAWPGPDSPLCLGPISQLTTELDGKGEVITFLEDCVEEKPLPTRLPKRTRWAALEMRLMRGRANRDALRRRKGTHGEVAAEGQVSDGHQNRQKDCRSAAKRPHQGRHPRPRSTAGAQPRECRRRCRPTRWAPLLAWTLPPRPPDPSCGGGARSSLLVGDPAGKTPAVSCVAERADGLRASKHTARCSRRPTEPHGPRQPGTAGQLCSGEIPWSVQHETAQQRGEQTLAPEPRGGPQPWLWVKGSRPEQLWSAGPRSPEAPKQAQLVRGGTGERPSCGKACQCSGC